MYKALFTMLLASAFCIAKSQDMNSMADELLGEQTEYALGTFYTTRIITGHSVFMMPQRGLDFRIHHRFGQFNSGFNNFYGIDESSSFLSLDYGINDRITLGLGRATYRDIFNGYAKFSILRQSSGGKNMPVSMVYVATLDLQSTIYDDPKRNEDFKARLSYTHQLLIARMFTPKLSLQVIPTLVHRNMIPEGDYHNNTYALGLGGRYKLTNTFSINGEWYHIFNPDNTGTFTMQDPLAFGIEIQVASHVFQVHITNSEYMTENTFLTETSQKFFKGDIRIGFNISQVFTF